MSEDFDFPALEVKLVQKIPLWGEQTVTLDGDCAKVSIKRPSNLQEYTVRLAELSPTPSRETNRKIMPLAWAISFCGGAAILIRLMLFNPEMMPLSAGLVLLIFCALGFIHHIRDWRERNYTQELYCDRTTGQPLLVFWVQYPDADSYQHFISLLKSRIMAEWQDARTGGPTVAEQLGHLRQMLEDGLLDDDEFKAAKTQILHTPGSDYFAGKN